MENIGAYITKEYGLLKNILKYLSFHDLLKARKVCRDWCKVVNRIFLNEFGRSPEVFFAEYSPLRKEEILFWNDMRSIPEIVIKYYADPDPDVSEFSVTSDLDILWRPLFKCELRIHRKKKEDEVLENCIRKAEESCIISPAILHFCCDGSFTYSSKQRNGPKISLHSSFFDAGGSSTVSLPKAPGVHYSIFNLSLKSVSKNKELNIQELQHCQEKGPIRCILLYENSYHRYHKAFLQLLRHIFDTVNSQQNTQFAFGGGKVNKMSQWTSESQENPDVCGIVIRGEKIIAHSDIMVDCYSSDEMDEFFDKFAKTAGPLPAGASRVALMAQCVDRPKSLARIHRYPEIDVECLEMLHFTNHFPDVPICGFLAGGEYGTEAASNESIEADGSSPPKKARLGFGIEHTVMHWQSTSVVLLTYLNAQAR